jgi:hypothetical protein
MWRKQLRDESAEAEQHKRESEVHDRWRKNLQPQDPMSTPEDEQGLGPASSGSPGNDGGPTGSNDGNATVEPEADQTATDEEAETATAGIEQDGIVESSGRSMQELEAQVLARIQTILPKTQELRPLVQANGPDGPVRFDGIILPDPSTAEAPLAIQIKYLRSLTAVRVTVDRAVADLLRAEVALGVQVVGWLILVFPDHMATLDQWSGAREFESDIQARAERINAPRLTVSVRVEANIGTLDFTDFAPPPAGSPITSPA